MPEKETPSKMNRHDLCSRCSRLFRAFLNLEHNLEHAQNQNFHAQESGNVPGYWHMVHRHLFACMSMYLYSCKNAWRCISSKTWNTWNIWPENRQIHAQNGMFQVVFQVGFSGRKPGTD